MMSKSYDTKDNYSTFDTTESKDPIYDFAKLLFLWCEVGAFYNFRNEVKKFETNISTVTSEINSIMIHFENDKKKIQNVKNSLGVCISNFIEVMKDYKEKYISSHDALKEANTILTLIKKESFSKKFFVRDYENQVFSDCETYLEKLIKNIDSIPGDSEILKKKTTYLEDVKERGVVPNSLGKYIYSHRKEIALTISTTVIIIIFVHVFR